LPTPRRVLDFARELRRGHAGQRGGNADRPCHRLWPNRTRRLPSVPVAGGALARRNCQVAPGQCDAKRSGSSCIQVPPGTAGCWEVCGAGHILGQGSANVRTEKGPAPHQLSGRRWICSPGAQCPFCDTPGVNGAAHLRRAMCRRAGLHP
jgi:hypothetical protein